MNPSQFGTAAVNTQSEKDASGPALHCNRNLRFHPIDNNDLICYSKHTADSTNVILTVVNLDPHHTHSGWAELPLSEPGLDNRQALLCSRPAG
jgi:hypothetical protein